MPVLVVRRDTFPNASEASLYRDTAGIRVTLHDPETFHVEYGTVTELTSDPVAKRILEMQSPKRQPTQIRNLDKGQKRAAGHTFSFG